ERARFLGVMKHARVRLVIAHATAAKLADAEIARAEQKRRTPRATCYAGGVHPRSDFARRRESLQRRRLRKQPSSSDPCQKAEWRGGCSRHSCSPGGDKRAIHGRIPPETRLFVTVQKPDSGRIVQQPRFVTFKMFGAQTPGFFACQHPSRFEMPMGT